MMQAYAEWCCCRYMLYGGVCSCVLVHCCTTGGVAWVLGGMLVESEGGLKLGEFEGAERHGSCVDAGWCLEVRSRKF